MIPPRIIWQNMSPLFSLAEISKVNSEAKQIKLWFISIYTVLGILLTISSGCRYCKGEQIHNLIRCFYVFRKENYMLFTQSFR